MAFVVASSSGVRIPARRNSSSPSRPSPWRVALKALTGGLWVVAVGVVAVMLLLLGTGWLLAISTSARSAVQPVSVLSIPPGRVDWMAPATTTMVEKSSASAAIADRFVFMAPVRVATVRVASIAPDMPNVSNAPSATEIRTGSIGPAPKALTKTDIALPVQPTRRAASDAPQVPLPRTKPKLASLGPSNLGIKPAEEPHPPRTAVYDISAQLVYLPNGERLEAHSGLGEHMDNPASSRLRMRGVTPPNTYALTLREALFHGVQALRMTPVDDDKMFGRDGILAHSYMLGPNGASNGCVSFKDYPRFLRAYLRGEIERIVVVPRLGRPPTFAFQSNTKA
jgi:hypothetical protein